MKKWYILIFFTLSVCPSVHTQTNDPIFIHPLIEERADLPGTFSCILVMADQAVDISFPITISKEEKTTLMYQALASQAETSQQPLLDSLDIWGVSYRSFYITNVIQATLDSTSLTKLGLRKDLKSILPDFPLTILPESSRTGDIRRVDTLLHWALDHIQADSVWRMGVTGRGVVVAGLDTGIEWDHEFLRKSYRGTQSNGHTDHNFNWHDGIRHLNPLHKDSIASASNNPCGLSTSSPCDDQGHGTLTMGLVTGQYEGQHTGVAPGAQWIGCRVMERGYGQLSTYLSGLEWCLAPTDISGQNPRPELAPDIINNSWACPALEGCIPDNYWILDSAAARLNRAGIFVIASAGNDGRSGCGSIQNPLAIFPSVFTVGATNNRDSIAAFSSRGPLTTSSVIKPEVVAPGQGITSIYPNGRFRRSSGTSISAPLVAGLAALILEANPMLMGRPDLLRDIIISSAVPISENPCTEASHPNSVYGYGRIDALRAVNLAREIHTSSVPEETNNFAILMYPNPMQHVLHLANENDENALITIYNPQGQVMKQISLKEWSNVDIEVSGFPPGLYFAHIFDGQGTFMQKLVKF